MEIIAVAIGLYALTRLMGDMTPSDSVDPIPEYPEDPVIPAAPTQAAYKIESVYSNGSYTLFCLYQLEGGAYEVPQSGLVTDNTAYNKVGHIVGDPLGTGFVSQIGGGFNFNLDGVDYTGVRIFTESSGKEYIDSKVEPDEDPLSPEVQPEDESPSSPSPEYRPQPSLGSSMNGYRRAGIL